MDRLTPQERKVYKLNAIGLQAKEIAEEMGISHETVKSYMKSIKEKLELQKDKEITAHYWIKNVLGKDFDEVKRQMIALCLLLIFVLYVPLDIELLRGRTLNARPRVVHINRRMDT